MLRPQKEQNTIVAFIFPADFAISNSSNQDSRKFMIGVTEVSPLSVAHHLDIAVDSNLSFYDRIVPVISTRSASILF